LSDIEPNAPTTEHSAIEMFDDFYYRHDCGVPYQRDDHWIRFFGEIADGIVRELHPTTVFDAGCAMGFLIEALRARAVDAWGVDVSEYAIANADPSVKEYCRVSSLSDPLPGDFPGHYDLVTCIEVVEHIDSAELPAVLDNLCARSDRILLSSSPDDYSEATHVNVRPAEQWAALFAARGFIRNFDAEVGFLTPWAVLFERSSLVPSNVVSRYERAYSRRAREASHLRQKVLSMQNHLAELERTIEGIEDVEPIREELARALRRIDELGAIETANAAVREELDALRGIVGTDPAAYLELRAEVLAARDHSIGLEAETGQLRGEVVLRQFALEEAQRHAAALLQQVNNQSAHIAGLEIATAHRDQLLTTPTWRIGYFIMTPARFIKRLLPFRR
jgi:hypothetical protein